MLLNKICKLIFFHIRCACRLIAEIYKRGEINMKHFNTISIIFSIQCILFATGCKVIDWGKENFQQTDRYDKEFTRHMKPYLRSTVVYDQFATVADFDALLLTDAARMVYVDYYKQRHLLSSEKEAVMRQRVLNENKYYISFYVLGSQPENVYPNDRSLFSGEYYKQQSLLGDKDAEWQVRLKVKDKEYAPDSVRVVELPVEYQHFFGAQYSQFKSVYLVKFDALNADKHEILASGSHKLELHFMSARYKTSLSWNQVTYTEK